MKKLNENGTFQGYLPYATVFLFYGTDCRYYAGVNPFSRIKKVLIKLACLQTLHFLFRDHRAHICAIRENIHTILRMASIFEPPHPCLWNFQNALFPLCPQNFITVNPHSCSYFSFGQTLWNFGRVCKYAQFGLLFLCQKDQLQKVCFQKISREKRMFCSIRASGA